MAYSETFVRSMIISTDCFVFSYVHDEITFDVMERVRAKKSEPENRYRMKYDAFSGTEISYVRLLLTAVMQGYDDNVIVFRFLLIRARNTFYPCITLAGAYAICYQDVQ